ncbi:TPA: hypothetical protein JLL90_001009 [Escherichia coli]|nr:hypothetical protein [Escherichia coli]
MGDNTLMAINNFKPFALDPNANVTSQADWEALPALLSGFTAGKASSAQVNKAIRQASFIAAALAQYTANKSGLDVLDDGDLNGFISKMGTAFGKDFQALDATLSALAGLATGANKLPYFTGNDTAAQTDLTSVGRDIIGKNTIADILTYLGLGDGKGRLIAVYRIEASRKITLPPGTKFVVADLIGAGGGGGSNSTTVQPGYASAAQGGNSGSRVVAKFDGYEGQEIDVTIGAGGTGGVVTPATGADGTTGGSTIVGSGIAATGGRGGIRGTAFNVLPTSGPTASPNADNTISNGVELIAQHTGHGGSSGFLFSDKNSLGGKGADSEFGTGGVAIGISAGINASGGNNARGNGAGGSGAVSIYGTGSTGVSMPGGAGANGLAILWVYG